MANPILEAIIGRLIKAGYPEGTAKKIASGELPMDFNSRMNRAREQGFRTEAYHTGDPNILEFNPNAGFGDRHGGGSWFSQEPEVSASYTAPESAAYRVLLDDRNFAQVDAGGSNWNDIYYDTDMNLPSGESYTLQELESMLGKNVIDTTDQVARAARDMGASGVEIPQVRDIGGNYSAMSKVIKSMNPDLDKQDWINDYDMYGGTNYSVQDPSKIRSYYGAAFDPDNKGLPNILGSAAPVAAGGILAALGMAPEEAEAGVFPYAFKMAEDALQRGSALFSEKALKSAARDASGNSRTAITMMSPDEFLRVVPTPENSISQKNVDKIAEHIKSGGKLDDVPFLTVKMDDEMKMPRYSGHEGRHRALALKQLGIEEMPVRIKMGDNMGIRWDQLHSGNPLTRKSLPDQVLHEGKGNTSSAFPIKKTPTGFETVRSAAPIAAGGILGALGLPENATAADVATAGMTVAPKEQARAETQQMILDALLGFMAPTPLGDATMDAYNRNRNR